MAKEKFLLRTNQQICEATGFNMSKDLAPVSSMEDKLLASIKKFEEDNSSEVPDQRKAAKGIRHYHHYKFVLYQHFLSEQENSTCSYSTFCRNWPSHIVKPKIGDYDRYVTDSDVADASSLMS